MSLGKMDYHVEPLQRFENQNLSAEMQTSHFASGRMPCAFQRSFTVSFDLIPLLPD